MAGAILSRVYRGMLRLYPRAFRAEYANEVLGVFDQAVRDASHHGIWPTLGVIFREFADWPLNVLVEHAHHKGKTMKLPQRNETDTIRLTRWIARTTSVFLMVLYGIILLVTEQPALLTVTIVAMTVSLLLAWRWEKWGGALTVGLALICTLLAGLEATFSFPNLDLTTRILWGLVCLAGTFIVWVSPHALIGWLFVSLARYTTHQAARPPAPQGLSNASL